ncbi:MAG TPA: amylo-alpha-1,6-glucosidase [Thermoanaerobaculia bacterium]|nr:amylo-alpha-1,6-glucosidase [Thermoanaerobaculia bacterium]
MTALDRPSSSPPAPGSEWLEADGSGGFASGTAGLTRTRRYHALLLTATAPPAGRFVLVNGFEAWVETPDGRFAISSQEYAPGVVSPDGAWRIAAFRADPWPTWLFRVGDDVRLTQEVFVSRRTGTTALVWRLPRRDPDVTLSVRLLFSGRDYHALHHENPAFRFEPQRRGYGWMWVPYEGVPAVNVVTNGSYSHEPDWYRNFFYSQERERGLDFTEDLASPGVFRFDFSKSEAVILLSTEPPAGEDDAVLLSRRLRAEERRRRSSFSSRLDRAADDYIVRRGEGKTIVAGYPWFTDWGRDTFIALRGLCLATGRLEDAREILIEWAGAVSEGMLPNRFPDNPGGGPGGPPNPRGNEPEYNSVDASLWYVVAVHDYLAACERARRRVWSADRYAFLRAVEAILEGYASGTRHGIRADSDGLLAAGVPGVQLTWMDAKVGDKVITPRIGKPVEVQALWINALRIGGPFSKRWGQMAEQATRSFAARFWNEKGGCLYDVVDCDHVAGTFDARFRPNQIFAVGGLPFAVLEGDRARRVVEAVERRLWTPMGLRSLAPDDPAYAGHYSGGVAERDGVYHQGTVWPWLAGPFAEAWVRVRESAVAARREAREKFLAPLLAHMDDAGLGHISEIADGDPPHTPRGCPFQAWSVGEALRLHRVVLAE